MTGAIKDVWFDEASSMPASIIAGISICGILVVVAIGIGLAALYYFVRRKTQLSRHHTGPPSQTNDAGTVSSHIVENPNEHVHTAVELVQAQSQSLQAFDQSQSLAELDDDVDLELMAEVFPTRGDSSVIAQPGAVCDVVQQENSSLRATQSNSRYARGSMSVPLDDHHMDQDPPNLPRWRDILSKSYHPLHNSHIVCPVPSAPSLSDLDHVPEAPSRSQSNLYGGTLSSLDLHHQSLQDINYRSAFQLVHGARSCGAMTEPAEHLASRPGEHLGWSNEVNKSTGNIPRSLDIERSFRENTRSASVPIG